MNAPQLLPITQETSLVSFTILVNGEPLPGTVPIISVCVHGEINRIPAAYLNIADGDAALTDWTVSNDSWFVPGSEIEISAGYHGEEAVIFKGIVTKHSLHVSEQQTELRVECRDKAIRMTTSRKCNVFEEMKDSEIAAELLDGYGLIGNIEETTITHAEMVQYNSADWDFLISRAEAVGAVCVAHDGQVDMLTPVVDTAAAATLRFGTNLVEFDAEIDGVQQYASVKAQTWNPTDQALVEVDASDPNWTTLGNLDPANIGALAGAAEYVLRQPGRLSGEEVQHWADAKLLRSRMAFVCGRARVEGFAALPGITVALEGLGDRFDGMGWVSGVRHEISQGNWFCDLQLGMNPQLQVEKFPVQSSPAAALLPGINGLHTAVVTALEGDPEAEGRVRVRIPSISSTGNGIWARVATLDAGNDRGTFFLPEIDDEVTVGFLDEDPRQPVILGAMHSSAKAAPLTATDDNHEKGYVSRSKMRMIFDDDKISLTIDTPAGNVLVLDDDSGQLQVKDQHGNQIVLSASGISIESASDIVMKASGNVKIESNQGLEMKAGTQFKAAGTAGLEVSSSANTVIKGGLVQIN